MYFVKKHSKDEATMKSAELSKAAQQAALQVVATQIDELKFRLY